MMQVQPVDLPEHTNRSLTALQAQIDAVPSYADRVQHARQRFEAENRPGNYTFDVIKLTLGSMCAGACRCMYCEDSMASEVEHFRPKTFYPDLVFSWLNYLYTCGPCNRIKRSHFRIVVESSEYIDLMRRRTDQVVEPRSGSPLLIDPRRDDPPQYLSLDLIDTFWFVPRHAEGTPEHARAEYTIKCLKLNERDYLPRARQEAYAGYRARLGEYVDARNTERAEHLAKAISRCGHPAVWAEMKAQSLLLPDLARLFAAAPEAAGW
jgi:uncharacterized protein (TIGR02646 family)